MNDGAELAPPLDQSLARALYMAHGPALERWARSRFGDSQVAEEIVQETVLAAWRKHHQFDPERGVERAWMFGIARNVAASRHRVDRRHLRSVPTEPVTDSALDDQAIERLTERSFVADAIRSLSPDHRDVVRLAYWEGQSTKEISARLGIPDGTVKSRLYYALRILRAHLEESDLLT